MNEQVKTPLMLWRLVLWRLEINRPRIDFKPDRGGKNRHVSVYSNIPACLSMWYYRAEALADILTQIPECPRRVPRSLCVWSCGFMFICPSRAKGQGWMWELRLAAGWPMVRITKKVIILTHTYTQSGFLSSGIDCSNLLIAAVRPQGGDEAQCILIPPLATPSSHYRSGDPSWRTGYHRGDVISFATTVIIGDEITCSHNALQM